MTKKTLTLTNAPKATGTVRDDSVDITEQLAALERADRDEQSRAAAETLLERAIKSDPDHAGVARGKLEEFRLSPLAKALLDKAVVNVAENTGRGLEDPKAQDEARLRASLIGAAGHDLPAAIELIIGAVPVAESTGMVYSLCYAVQKALNFIGNMAYRRALDPKADTSLDDGSVAREDGSTFAADQREEHVDPPVGLGPDTGEELAFDPNTGERLFNVAGGVARKANHELLLEALEEAHILLQLYTEAFGWPAEQAMPYCAVQNKDGTFSQVHDLEHCLDLMEVKYKENRAKRQDRRLEMLRIANAAALASLKKAASK